MKNFKLCGGLCVCLCASLSPLSCEDIRNGFFIEGGFGARNEVLSLVQDVPNPLKTGVQGMGQSVLSSLPSKYASVASLQAALNKDLQQLVLAIEKLNAQVTQVTKAGAGSHSVQSLQQMNLDTSHSKALQAQIQAEIQDLQAMASAPGMTASAIQANKAVIEEYSRVLASLETLEQGLVQEAQAYNQALGSQQNTQVQQQANYQDKLEQYNKDMKTYHADVNSFNQARARVVADIGDAAVPNNAARATVQSMQTDLNNLESLVTKDPKIGSSGFQNAYQQGVKSAQDSERNLQEKLEGTFYPEVSSSVANAGDFFEGLLQKSIANPPQNLQDLIKAEAWFEQEVKNINDVHFTHQTSNGYLPQSDQAESDEQKRDTLRQGLLGVYQSYFSVLKMQSSGQGPEGYGGILPTNPFSEPTKPTEPVAQPFKFEGYHNYADQIAGAVPGTIRAVTGSPVHSSSAAPNIQPSLAPLVSTINGASKLYSNVGYNTNLSTGYQHFFSRRWGFSAQAGLGYEWFSSPLFSKSPLFNRLQGLRMALGGHLIYDFKAPQSQRGLYCGVFVGLLGTNNHYFLTTKSAQTYWKYSFNVHVSAGLRFQLRRSVLKLGVSSPLVPRVVNLQAGSTRFLIHETFRNFNLYASYAVLFGRP